MNIKVIKTIKGSLPMQETFGCTAINDDGREKDLICIFPEIEYDQILKLRGMDIVFVTTAKTNEEAFELLSGFGMPFRK